MSARLPDEIGDMIDGKPTVADLEQDQFTHPAVPVRVVDPVATQELPTVTGVSRNWNLDNVTPVAVLQADMRRSRATLLSDADFYIGPDRDQVRQGYSAKWQAAVPLEIKSRDQWWAMSVGAACILSVINDQWAE